MHFGATLVNPTALYIEENNNVITCMVIVTRILFNRAVRIQIYVQITSFLKKIMSM